eukprot:gene22913-biopygen22268
MMHILVIRQECTLAHRAHSPHPPCPLVRARAPPGLENPRLRGDSTPTIFALRLNFPPLRPFGEVTGEAKGEAAAAACCAASSSGVGGGTHRRTRCGGPASAPQPQRLVQRVGGRSPAAGAQKEKRRCPRPCQRPFLRVPHGPRPVRVRPTIRTRQTMTPPPS